jgi:excisionase family DNA binding protein
MLSEEYLTTAEVAKRLKLSPKTVQNKIASGQFKLGVHFFKPKGMSVRFKWSAVTVWMEGTETGAKTIVETSPETLIPLARRGRPTSAARREWVCSTWIRWRKPMDLRGGSTENQKRLPLLYDTI